MKLLILNYSEIVGIHPRLEQMEPLRWSADQLDFFAATLTEQGLDRLLQLYPPCVVREGEGGYQVITQPLVYLLWKQLGRLTLSGPVLYQEEWSEAMLAASLPLSLMLLHSEQRLRHHQLPELAAWQPLPTQPLLKHPLRIRRLLRQFGIPKNRYYGTAH